MPPRQTAFDRLDRGRSQPLTYRRPQPVSSKLIKRQPYQTPYQKPYQKPSKQYQQKTPRSPFKKSNNYCESLD